MPSAIIPTLFVCSFGYAICYYVDAPITCLLKMTCASAVVSHEISRLLLSCDRISIKLELTGKSRLISQFYATWVTQEYKGTRKYKCYSIQHYVSYSKLQRV